MCWEKEDRRWKKEDRRREMKGNSKWYKCWELKDYQKEIENRIKK